MPVTTDSGLLAAGGHGAQTMSQVAVSKPQPASRSPAPKLPSPQTHFPDCLVQLQSRRVRPALASAVVVTMTQVAKSKFFDALLVRQRIWFSLGPAASASTEAFGCACVRMSLESKQIRLWVPSFI